MLKKMAYSASVTIKDRTAANDGQCPRNGAAGMPATAALVGHGFSECCEANLRAVADKGAAYDFKEYGSSNQPRSIPPLMGKSPFQAAITANLAAGLSQEALADRAGLHRTYISLLERGLRMPSIAVVKQLAKGLNTTMTSLMGQLERS